MLHAGAPCGCRQYMRPKSHGHSRARVCAFGRAATSCCVSVVMSSRVAPSCWAALPRASTSPELALLASREMRCPCLSMVEHCSRTVHEASTMFTKRALCVRTSPEMGILVQYSTVSHGAICSEQCSQSEHLCNTEQICKCSECSQSEHCVHMDDRRTARRSPSQRAEEPWGANEKVTPRQAEEEAEAPPVVCPPAAQPKRTLRWTSWMPTSKRSAASAIGLTAPPAWLWR